MVALYASQVSANAQVIRGSASGGGGWGRPAPPSAGGATGSTGGTVSIVGDDPSDGELTQVLVPLDALGGQYTMQGTGGKAVLRATVTRLDAEAYTAWEPLPSDAQVTGGTMPFTSHVISSGEGPGTSVMSGPGGIRVSGFGGDAFSLTAGSW
jgi:hypothetical protein